MTKDSNLPYVNYNHKPNFRDIAGAQQEQCCLLIFQAIQSS